ncbi:MAG: hypothetical protein GX564_12175 [Oligosphaeraceae bacterium]|nr:hypothetical protein [Oligosphaeraceae bacterium]
MGATETHKLFAWGGLSFLIPGDWDLAQSRQDGEVQRLVLEDLLQPRLEVDWQVPAAGVRGQDIQKRCQKHSAKVAAAALAVQAISGLSERWTAHHYALAGERILIVAYILPREPGEPLVFFRMHCTGRQHSPLPETLFRQLAGSYRWHGGDSIPWNFYDVSFRLPSCFRLTGTGLDAGRKLLAFAWGLRRLYLWHFSLAEQIRQQKDFPHWAVDFLHASAIMPVPFWQVNVEHELYATRRKRFFLGQFEEIGRLCFRYAAGYRHRPEKNQLALWLFQYRRDDDLRCLQEGMEFT